MPDGPKRHYYVFLLPSLISGTARWSGTLHATTRLSAPIALQDSEWQSFVVCISSILYNDLLNLELEYRCLNLISFALIVGSVKIWPAIYHRYTDTLAWHGSAPRRDVGGKFNWFSVWIYC